MMTESKADQIKRLQGNLAEHSSLCDSDKLFFSSVPKSEIEVLHSDGYWHDKVGDCFCKSDRHRIKSSDNPAPDTPVFAGYVLCEVLPASPAGNITFRHFNGNAISLHKAITFGCCGGVFKENPTMMSASLIAYCKPGVLPALYEFISAREFKDEGYIPATLGWVAFEEVE